MPNFILRSDYAGGYSCWVFNAIAGTDEEMFSRLKKAHTRLSARFDNELPEPVTAIIYGLFPAEFQIDHARNVTV